MEILAITNWAERFENKDSRKIANARWVPVPNKHDGLGFRRIAAHPRQCEIFSSWNLILQIASRMPIRGFLHNGDTALDSEDLAVMTGFPQEGFEIAIEVLTQEKIGWLELARELPTNPEKKARSERERPGSQGANPPETGESPASPGNDPASSREAGPEQKGTEGNRTEGKDSEGKSGASPHRTRFTPPTLDELIGYFAEKLNDEPKARSEAEDFLNHYEANGWMVGRVKMKDWKASVRNWIKNGNKFNGGSNGTKREIKPVRGQGF